MKLQRAVKLPGMKMGRWETIASDGVDPISSLHRELLLLFKTGTDRIIMRRGQSENVYRGVK